MRKSMTLLLLLMMVSVLAQEPLFDITVEIPKQYRSVQPGDELLTSIKLVNVGSAGRIDVFLDYWITGPSGTILQKKETVAVETQANFVRTFDIPSSALPGSYEMHAKITYFDGREALSHQTFQIVSIQGASLGIKSLIILAVIVGIILFFLVFRKLHRYVTKFIIRAKIRAMVKNAQS